METRSFRWQALATSVVLHALIVVVFLNDTRPKAMESGRSGGPGGPAAIEVFLTSVGEAPEDSPAAGRHDGEHADRRDTPLKPTSPKAEVAPDAVKRALSRPLDRTAVDAVAVRSAKDEATEEPQDVDNSKMLSDIPPVPTEKPMPPSREQVRRLVASAPPEPGPPEREAMPSRSSAANPDEPTSEPTADETSGDGPKAGTAKTGASARTVASGAGGIGDVHEGARYSLGSASCPKPVYPRMARMRGQEGRVVLTASVAADGRVTGVNVTQTSGHSLLDRSAVQTVSGWVFEPARRAGVAVPAVETVSIRFDLTDV